MAPIWGNSSWTCDTMSPMAKKKSQGKKHKFKYAEPTGVSATQEAAPVSAPATKPTLAAAQTRARVQAVAAASSRDFSYVGADVKRIGILAVALFGVEVLLWYLFGHTGLGSAI